jgi:hypothetical protein
MFVGLAFWELGVLHVQLKKSSLYVAGSLHVTGLAIFLVFLLASSGAISIPAAYKHTFGLLGLVLWITGFVWALMLRKRKLN